MKEKTDIEVESACEKRRREPGIASETPAADGRQTPGDTDDAGSATRALRLESGRDGRGNLALLRKKGFIQTADCDRRVFDPSHPNGGGLIQNGSEIIVDPELLHGNDPCWPAKEPYLSIFIKNGFSFEKNLPEETLSQFQEAAGLAKRFGTAIAFNMQEWASKGRTMPLFDLAGSPSRRAPSFMYRGGIDRTKELTLAHPFIKWLKRSGIIPAEEGYSRDSISAIESANECRIFELRGGRMTYRIFAMFVAPVSKDGELVPLDDWMYASLTGKDGYVHIIKEDNGDPVPDCTFVVLGTPKGFSKSISPGSLPHIFEMLAAPFKGEYWDSTGGWSVDCPSRRLSTAREKAFVHSLYPQTMDDLSERMFAYLEAHPTGGHSATIEEGRNALGLPGGSDYFVARVFNHMLAKRPSRCYFLKSANHSIVGDGIALGTPAAGTPAKNRFHDELSDDEQWKRAVRRLIPMVVFAAFSFLFGAIVLRAIQVDAIGKVWTMEVPEAVEYMLRGMWRVVDRFRVAAGIGGGTLIFALARRFLPFRTVLAKIFGDPQC